MSDYIVSARKYRPNSFDTVVGQEAIVSTLKNSIQTGKLAHAYLFCGPRGVGKTTCARIFAKTINCQHPRPDGEACGECDSCRSFDEQRSLNILELDAASNNSVDEIRDLIEQVQIPPQVGRYRVFIIDEVHMLTTSAFNAFLKTLEEPPAHAIFILATTEKHKILPTILSRCQIYDFQRMGIADMMGHLRYVVEQEGYRAEPAALNVIAQKADGGMRDALSMLDQAASFCGGHITYDRVIENLGVLDYDYYFRMVDHMLQRQIPESLLLYNEILRKGYDGAPFINGLAAHMRDLLVCRDAQTASLLEASDDIRQRYIEQAQRCQSRWLYRTIRLCNDCDQEYRTSRNKRLSVELTLIECTQALDDDPGAARRRRITLLQPLFGSLRQAPAHVRSISTTTSSPTATTAPAAPSITSKPKTPATTPLRLDALSPSIRVKSPATSNQSGEMAFADVQNADERRETGVQSPASGVQRPADTTPLITPNDILVHWQAFASNYAAEDKALSSRMAILQPHLQDDGITCTLVVSNHQLKTQIEGILPRLLAYMRKQLGNSHISFVLSVAEAATTTGRIFDKGKQFQHLCQLNPELKRLTEAYHLELL